MLVLLIVIGVVALVFGRNGLACLGAVGRIAVGILLLLVGASIA
jgi:hypothetical protein